jgi:hypothetical protein
MRKSGMARALRAVLSGMIALALIGPGLSALCAPARRACCGRTAPAAPKPACALPVCCQAPAPATLSQAPSVVPTVLAVVFSAPAAVFASRVQDSPLAPVLESPPGRFLAAPSCLSPPSALRA